MNDVESEDERNLQARLLHRDALQAIAQRGVNHIQKRADLTTLYRLLDFTATRARTGWRPVRLLVQLTYFLLERHLLEERLDSTFDLRRIRPPPLRLCGGERSQHDRPQQHNNERNSDLSHARSLT